VLWSRTSAVATRGTVHHALAEPGGDVTVATLLGTGQFYGLFTYNEDDRAALAWGCSVNPVSGVEFERLVHMWRPRVASATLFRRNLA
jgi:hypothetical protein